MKSYVKFQKTIFSKWSSFFFIFFIVTIISVISSTQIACDVMYVQYVQKQPPEVLSKKGVLKNFANLTGKRLSWCFPVKLAKFLITPNFDEHMWTTADQMICNKILLEKIRAVFRISIKFDLSVRKTSWKKIRFQLTLNKTYSPTPLPLIQRRFKHRQRTKINKAMLSVSSLLHAKFTISVLKNT